MGVLAHELGHINKYHVTKRIKSINKLRDIDSITNLSLIAGSLISNNSEYLMQSIITNKVGIQNYYKAFSRDQEREADYYAIETLNKLKLSADPLVEFLVFLEKKSIQKGYNSDYKIFSTHPVYEERFTIINALRSNQKNTFDKKINKRFNFIKAKLFGFTENNINVLNEHLEEDYLDYGKSILLSKKGRLKESMKLLNQVIKKEKNANYLLETKADILFSNGYSNEALLFYQESSKNIPSNNYVKKRIFDINFAKLNYDNTNKAIDLFIRFSYLLDIFENNIELKNKFKTIAINSEMYEWIEYFNIDGKKVENSLQKSEMINKMNQIKSKTSSEILVKLINRYLSEINEKI